MTSFVRKCRKLGFKGLHEFPSDFKKEVADYIKNKYNVDICIGEVLWYRPSVTALREKISNGYVPKMIILHGLPFCCKYKIEYMEEYFKDEYICCTRHNLYERLKVVYEDLVKIELKSNELLNEVFKKCKKYEFYPFILQNISFLVQNLTYTYSIIEYYLGKSLTKEFLEFLKCKFLPTEKLDKLVDYYTDYVYIGLKRSIDMIDAKTLHYPDFNVPDFKMLIRSFFNYLDYSFMTYTFFIIFPIFEKEFNISFSRFIELLRKMRIIIEEVYPLVVREAMLGSKDIKFMKELYNKYELIEKGVEICEFIESIVATISKYNRSMLFFEMNLYHLYEDLTYFVPIKIGQISYEICKTLLICSECLYLDC